jgi:tetratricopeptide (TPR) repeat protein
LQNVVEAALRERIQFLSSDAEAHARLTTLYLEAGKVFDARAAAERGLGFSPGDEQLAKLLARAALSAGGPNEVVSAFTRLRERFPQQALVYWYPALERLKSALAVIQLDSRFSIPAQLDQAMLGFRECGRLDPRYLESCRQYEAMCICLRGWQLLAQDRLELSRDWFLKMNSVSPGSIGMDPADVDAQFKGQLQDGLSGLARVAERHRDVHQDLPSAAAVFADLARVAPQELSWVLAAAKSAELAAEGLEGEADELEAARTGAVQAPARLSELRRLARVKDREVGSAKELERFASAAVQRRENAQQFYASAWESYLAAVALDPEDARLACDAARIAVYQTKREPARAEQLLLRSIQLAQAQSASSELNSSARAALEQSWGDALQYLGVLELETKLDYTAARQHLEQSLEHGARPYVREVLLPKAVAASKLERATTAASTPSDTDDSKKPR